MKKQIIKYILLTAAGVALFLLANHAATISRGYDAIGGEGAFILLPVLWWLIGRTGKETKNIITEVMKND